MKEFNPDKQIESVDDYNDYCTEIFHSFLESAINIEGMTREITEEDSVACDEEFAFMWTRKGTILVERMLNRLHKVGEAHFPGEDIEINSHLFREP